MDVKACTSLDEVRHEIDTLDREIVALIAKRNAYVHQAAKFKVSVDEIKAPERMAEVVSTVRAQALELGLNPNFINELYEMMINEMVEVEISEFANAKNL